MLRIKVPAVMPLDTDKRLDLTDQILEHSVVVGALLEVIYNFELPPLSEATLVLRLIDLADKWDVPMVHRIVKKTLESSWYAFHASKLDLFLIAIKLKEYRIASELMTRENVARSKDDNDGNEYPYQYDDFPPVQIVYGRSCRGNWDDRGWTQLHDIASSLYRDFIRIPPHVAWALQRATVMWDHGLQDSYMLMGCDDARRLQRKKFLAENFRRIMDPKCAYTVPFIAS